MEIKTLVEDWRPVRGYEGLYEVSSGARVRSLRRKATAGKILKQFKHNGYLVVCLSRRSKPKTYAVHTLILEAFVGVRPENFHACHYNGVKVDCRLSNLRWDSVKANHEDKIRHDEYRKTIKLIFN